MTETGKHPILLVDDEPEILFSLKGLLRREFELHTAESGKEALKILNQHPIHVVMTDQRMPEMTGVQLMERVAEHHPEAIRIVFTGYADIKAVVDAINSGGLYRYITKPWDPDELIAVLHEAAAKYDEVVERERLLADLSQHVRQGQDLAAALLAAESRPATGAVDVAEFAERARQLNERLDRAVQEGK
jgi:DNA-binding NtrC family response regulator